MTVAFWDSVWRSRYFDRGRFLCMGFWDFYFQVFRNGLILAIGFSGSVRRILCWFVWCFYTLRPFAIRRWLFFTATWTRWRRPRRWSGRWGRGGRGRGWVTGKRERERRKIFCQHFLYACANTRKTMTSRAQVKYLSLPLSLSLSFLWRFLELPPLSFGIKWVDRLVCNLKKIYPQPEKKLFWPPTELVRIRSNVAYCVCREPHIGKLSLKLTCVPAISSRRKRSDGSICCCEAAWTGRTGFHDENQAKERWCTLRCKTIIMSQYSRCKRCPSRSKDASVPTASGDCSIWRFLPASRSGSIGDSHFRHYSDGIVRLWYVLWNCAEPNRQIALPRAENCSVVFGNVLRLAVHSWTANPPSRR